MSGRCRHRGGIVFESAFVYCDIADHRCVVCASNAGTTVAGQSRCERCGVVVPLGPANDADPRVQIERRAAELAALAHEALGVVRTANLDEQHGWRDQRDEDRGGDCRCCDLPGHITNNWHAGYLARCIVTHDDKETK